MNRTEVIVCEWPKPLKNQYFKNIIPEISITKCPTCNRVCGVTVCMCEIYCNSCFCTCSVISYGWLRASRAPRRSLPVLSTWKSLCQKTYRRRAWRRTRWILILHHIYYFCFLLSNVCHFLLLINNSSFINSFKIS